jgi:membrane protein
MSSGGPRDRLPAPTQSLPVRLGHAAEQARILRARVGRARRRFPALDTALATIEQDSDIGGGILAGALAYWLFLFALPLAFFLVSGLGVIASVLNIDPENTAKSAGLAGLVTQQVATAAESSSNWWVALKSFLLLAYVTRTLLRALTVVYALAWERSAAAAKVRPRALGLFAAAIVTQLALVALVGVFRERTTAGGIAALVSFLLAEGAIWLVVSLHLPHANARGRDLVPGALFFAVGMTAVQVFLFNFNVYVLGRVLAEKSDTYGALGAAAAVLLSLFLIGRVLVAAAVVDATLFERRTQATAEVRTG